MSDVRPSPMAIWLTAVQVGQISRYRRRLCQLGFGYLAQRSCGVAGVLRVHWPSGDPGDDCFQPDPMGGVAAVILPIWSNGLIDLAAWDVRGGRIATLTGDAFALGESLIEGSDKIKVFSDPGAWWRACPLPPVAAASAEDVEGAEPPIWPHTPLDRPWLFYAPPGIVILDWANAWKHLGHVSQVIADSVELGERLDQLLKPPRQHRPKIGVDISTSDARAA